MVYYAVGDAAILCVSCDNIVVDERALATETNASICLTFPVLNELPVAPKRP